MAEATDSHIRRPSGHQLTDQNGLPTKLEALRSLEVQRRRGRTFAMAVLVGTVLAIALATCDYLVPLPFTWRAMGVVLTLTVCLWIVSRARQRFRYTTGEAAADVEAAFPSLGQRVRTTVDYTLDLDNPAAAEPGMVRALEAETHELVSEDDFAQASSPRGFHAMIVASLSVIIMCALCIAFMPELRVTAARILLLPMHYTTVSVNPIEKRIAQGKDLDVEVDVRGRPVEKAEVCYRPTDTGGDWKTQPLLSLGSSGPSTSANKAVKLTATIKDCREDLELFVVAGPTSHSVQRVRVVPPLELRVFSATAKPPDYLGLGAEVFDQETFSVREGSCIRLHFELNRPPTQAELNPKVVDDPEATIGLIPLTVNENILSAELPDVRHSMQFTLVAKSADQIALDSPMFHIRVQPDKKPRIRIVIPEQDLEVIPTTEVPLAIEAQDDTGLSKVGLIYKVGNGPPQTLWEQELAQSKDSFFGQQVLPLETHELTVRDAVTFYAYAEDNYFNEPRRVCTELKFIDIRPFKREYQIVPPCDGESCGACQGTSATLEELIRQERHLVKETFAAGLVRDGLVLRSKRLAEAQQDTLASAREFTQKLSACVGAIPPLEQAIEEMVSAESALSSNNLELGLSLEEAALASLIKARQNVRKFLRESSSSVASQCRNIDRQQQQKLRRPKQEKSKDRNERSKQLAKACENLQQMAKKQRQWACKACPPSETAGQPSSPRQTGESSSAKEPPTDDQLAEEQQASIDQAERTKQELRKASRGGQVPEQRMDSARDAMGEALERLNADQREAAAKSAEQAAQRLDKLAKLLASLSEPDFDQQLAEAGHLARDLAEREECLAGDTQRSSPSAEPKTAQTTLGDRQRDLVDQTEELDELIRRLTAEAREEEAEVLQMLEEACGASPCNDILLLMGQVAEDIDREESTRATKSALAASRSLRQLADDLDSIHRQVTQPDLEALLEVEQQAADLLKRLLAARNETERALARSQLENLKENLAPLSRRDQRLAQAEQSLRNPDVADSSSPGSNRADSALLEERRLRSPTEEGQFGHSDPVLVSGLRQVTKVLQRIILEANLEHAMANPDAAVPPDYVEMVEEYYETLSKDER